MSKSCEQIRQLLVELEYGELDEVDANAVRAHLHECDACAARQAAYRAVRADLQAWDQVEPAPSRVTFVAMHRAVAPAGWGPVSKGLAVAASFLLGFLLTASVASVRISRSAGGWSVSTGLWPAPAAAAGTDSTTGAEATRTQARPALPVEGVTPIGTNSSRPGGQGISSSTAPGNLGRTGRLRIMSPVELDRWLENRLRTAAAPAPVSETGLQSLTQEQIAPLLERLTAQRDAQLRKIVEASEQKQREEFDSALAGVYQTFDAQRTNDLLFLAGQLGLLQENTGLELQRTNAAIDYLISRSAEDQGQRDRQDDRQ